MMKLTIVLELWWVCSQIRGFVQGIPLDIVIPEKNISDEISSMSIQITEYPGGHVLLITPEQLLTNVSTHPPTKTVPSSNENTDQHLQTVFNQTLLGLQKQLTDILSKVTVLESKLERKLIQDVKKSPNVFFVPPNRTESSPIGRSALEHLRDRITNDRVEWMIPPTEPIPPAPEPPSKHLFSRIIPHDHSTSSSVPEQQIDLLNRSKRRSERTRETPDKKSKVLSLCAQITPFDEKIQNSSAIASIRRSKRTRRDVLSNTDKLKEPPLMSGLLRASFKEREKYRITQNAVLRAFIMSNFVMRDKNSSRDQDDA
ncbi:uncharacterized protein LOC135162910 [Diachasmimorpha longicaudata]|uniref:uncharacterized protein LOC135162910 n=1 Tax=Diachasmimorpha longicaudata TaxID=58733 RepID=UPI0030B9014D